MIFYWNQIATQQQNLVLELIKQSQQTVIQVGNIF